MRREPEQATSVTVFIFANHRARYLPIALNELVRCEAVRASCAAIVILADRFSFMQALRARRRLRKAASISVRLNLFHRRGNSYWQKLAHVESSTSPYVVKCDEDIFMTSAGWDVFLSQAPDEDVVLSPVLSTGIPTVEHFLDACRDRGFASEIRASFSGQRIPDTWGQDYSALPDYYAPNPTEFFESVEHLQTDLKGVHPIRFSETAQWRLARHCVEEDWWRETHEPRTVPLDFPYLCNSLILTTPTVYKRLLREVRRGRLSFDGYDEIGLNRQAREGRLRIEVLLGCHAVHPSYNSCGPVYESISDYFFREVSRA